MAEKMFWVSNVTF